MAQLPLTAQEKLWSAKLKIRSSFPFVSYLASQLNLMPDHAIQTACINAKFVMRYNPAYVLTKTSPEVQWLLAHELFHIVLGHLTYTSKIPNFNASKWNIACDLKVNDTLEVEGIGQAIQGSLLPDRNHEYVLPSQTKISNIDTKSALEIYAEVPDQDAQDLSQNCPNGQYGDGEHEPSQGASETSDQKNADSKTAQASMAGERGRQSDAMKRLIDRILNPKIDWRERLQRFVQNYLPSSQTWARPSRKFLANGIIFPGVLKETINICFAIDTSGSMSEQMLKSCLSEMKNIVKSFSNVNIHVLVGDADLLAEFDVANDDEVNEVQMSGGGGTSHEFVYEYCKKENPQCCIMFTDGYSDIPSCERTIGMDCTKLFLAPEGQWTKSMEGYGEVLEIPHKEGDGV